jgi:predicted transcriptional regulator
VQTAYIRIIVKKDAVLTVRLPARTRRRLDALARREGRSASAQAERLIEQGMGKEAAGSGRTRGARSLAGVLRGGLVPTISDFREVRALISASMLRRTRPHDDRRR